MKKIKLSYSELFQLTNTAEDDFDKALHIADDLFVDTPSGLTNINALVVKQDLDMLEIEFEDGTSCRVADTHIFMCNGEEVYAKDAEVIDCRLGQMKITNKRAIGKHNGYDININNPHWYYAPNGVVYHNSLIMTDLISGMIKQGKNILLVSMEMQDKEIMKRVHANAMDLPINSLIDLSKTEGELKEISKTRSIISKEQVIDAYNRLKMEGNTGKLFVKDYPSGTFSALQLEQLVESYKIEKGIKFDIVFLDYLGIMKSDRVSPAAGLYSYIKSIGEEVRASAHKLDLAIVSANQLNRSSLMGDVKETDNSSIADSMGTAMTADFMLFLLQDEEMKARGEIILKCTKNRFTGMTDLWLMNIDYTRMRFNDMVHQMTDGEIGAAVGLDLDEDFGIITAKKMESATEFANTEVKEIMRESAEQLFAKPEEQTDEQKSEIDQIYADLGI